MWKSHTSQIENNTSQIVFVQAGHGTGDPQGSTGYQPATSLHLLTTGTYLGLGMGREDLDVSILYDTKLGPQAKVPLMPLLNFIHYD